MEQHTNALQILRVGLGVRQFDLAHAATVSPGRLSLIERGITQPSPEEFDRIIDALGPAARELLPVTTKLVEAFAAAREVWTGP